MIFKVLALIIIFHCMNSSPMFWLVFFPVCKSPSKTSKITLDNVLHMLFHWLSICICLLNCSKNPWFITKRENGKQNLLQCYNKAFQLIPTSKQTAVAGQKSNFGQSVLNEVASSKERCIAKSSSMTFNRLRIWNFIVILMTSFGS